MGITCWCVCALGDSTMCQCLCGCDSQCVVPGHVRPCYPEWGILGDISAPVSLVLGLCWAEVMWLTQAQMLMLLLCKVLADRRVCLPGLQMCVCGLCSNCLWNCLFQAQKCWVWPQGPWVTISCGLLSCILQGGFCLCGQASQCAHGVSVSCDL